MRAAFPRSRFEHSNVSGIRYRVVAVPVSSNVALVLASSTKDTQTTLNDLGLVLLFVGVGGIIIAAVAGSARRTCRTCGRSSD